MMYQFKEKELKDTLKKLEIIIDTREQANEHVIDFFDKKKIPYRVEKLSFGDYSCLIPRGSFEGQQRDIYFTNDIVIERKFCIDELAMNLRDNKTNINEIKQEIIDLLGKKYLEKVLKTDYNRLKYEFANMNRHGVNFFILIEDKNFDHNIRNNVFRTKYDPETLYRRLKALESEFNTMIRPIDKAMMGSEVYNTCKYRVRDILKNKGFIEESVSNE